MPSFGWLRSGRHIRRPAACPDSSCESREGLHMHMQIDMQIEMQVSARGRARASDGMPADGLEASRRSMAGQGKGRARVRVKQKRGGLRAVPTRYAGRWVA